MKELSPAKSSAVLVDSDHANELDIYWRDFSQTEISKLRHRVEVNPELAKPLTRRWTNPICLGAFIGCWLLFMLFAAYLFVPSIAIAVDDFTLTLTNDLQVTPDLRCSHDSREALYLPFEIFAFEDFRSSASMADWMQGRPRDDWELSEVTTFVSARLEAACVTSCATEKRDITREFDGLRITFTSFSDCEGHCVVPGEIAVDAVGGFCLPQGPAYLRAAIWRKFARLQVIAGIIPVSFGPEALLVVSDVSRFWSLPLLSAATAALFATLLVHRLHLFLTPLLGIAATAVLLVGPAAITIGVLGHIQILELGKYASTLLGIFGVLWLIFALLPALFAGRKIRDGYSALTVASEFLRDRPSVALLPLVEMLIASLVLWSCGAFILRHHNLVTRGTARLAALCPPWSVLLFITCLAFWTITTLEGFFTIVCCARFTGWLGQQCPANLIRSLGSAAFGAILMTTVYVLRKFVKFGIQYVARGLGQAQSSIGPGWGSTMVISILEWIYWALQIVDRGVRFISRQSYVKVASDGVGYLRGCRRSFGLVWTQKRYVLAASLISRVIRAAVSLTAAAVAGGLTISGILVLGDRIESKGHFMALVAVVLGWLVGRTSASPILSATDTFVQASIMKANVPIENILQASMEQGSPRVKN